MATKHAATVGRGCLSAARKPKRTWSNRRGPWRKSSTASTTTTVRHCTTEVTAMTDCQNVAKWPANVALHGSITRTVWRHWLRRLGGKIECRTPPLPETDLWVIVFQNSAVLPGRVLCGCSPFSRLPLHLLQSHLLQGMTNNRTFLKFHSSLISIPTLARFSYLLVYHRPYFLKWKIRIDSQVFTRK